MQNDEIVEIESGQPGKPSKTKKWKATPDIEELCLATLGDALHLKRRASDQRLEEFYQHGYLLYKAGHYEKAKSYFNMLMVGNPQEPKYVMAAAACGHMIKEYSFAISLYVLASILDMENPIPLYYAADCYIKALDPMGAAVALQMAIDRCVEPKLAALKKRMAVMLERVEKELVEKREQGAQSFFTITEEDNKRLQEKGIPSIYDEKMWPEDIKEDMKKDKDLRKDMKKDIKKAA